MTHSVVRLRHQGLISTAVPSQLALRNAGEVAASGESAGALILNADDWGRDRTTTERTVECVRRGAVSSVSAMVFMADSERAAAIAHESNIDAALHLNFTTPFSACASPRLAEHQSRIGRRLWRHRLAQVVFDPLLFSSFEYTVSAQFEEYHRLYGKAPRRIDGHHHMHLCANVVFGKLLPAGAVVRRNFSFEPDEKGIANRFYRRVIDRIIVRRHVVTDFFFSIEPLEPRSRLERIFALSRRHVVEVETHPVNPAEYRFLAEGEIFRWTKGCPVASSFAV